MIYIYPMTATTVKQISLAAALLIAGVVWQARAFDPELDPAGMDSDSLLFTIELSGDSTSLFFADWSDNIRNSLAGPVMMSGNRFLFHSKNGYALYDIGGKLVEEHSLIKDNQRAAAAGRPRTWLAYPFDGETLIYYTDSDTLEVFRKKIGRRNLERVPAEGLEMFRDIKRAEPLNIYRSGTNEDVGRKIALLPHLAGFSAMEGGRRWWSTNIFFSFTSPMIMETSGEFTSFFPGIKIAEEDGGNCDVQMKLVEPIGVFSREGRWYYVGLQSEIGDKEDEYFQTIVLCDQAGNVLYCSRLLKQEITNAVLQERKDINTVFTVRRAGRHVFVPAVDPLGDIFYGVVNWEWKKIEMYKRSFERFQPSPSAPAFGDRFDREGRLSFYPIKIDCSAASRRGIEPEVMYKDDRGAMKVMDREDMMKDSMFVMVHRLPDEDLRRRIGRVVPTMPAGIGAMQDSIAKLPTTWCPYGISLNHEARGRLSNLDYGFGDVVVCSWVLGTSQSGNVYVRVDLEDWAEVVVFTREGRFIERFTFNNTRYGERKDVLVLDPRTEQIYERDYEAGMNARGKVTGYRFVVWQKRKSPLVPTVAPAAQGRPKAEAEAGAGGRRRRGRK